MASEKGHEMRFVKSRVEYLLRTEGVRGLLSGAVRYVGSMGRRVVSVERFVIYQFETDVGSLPVRCPGIAGLEVVVLERNEDVERLARSGYPVPVYFPTFHRRWLDRGGVAFCAYIDREPAHLAWAAFSKEARGCCDYLPYQVDFEHGEACWGGAYTPRRFRGLGLYTYVCGIRLKYMHEHGYSRCRDAVRVGNHASLRGQGFWNPRPRLSGRFVRCFRWTRWHEYPCELGGLCGQQR